jgi:two-component sensor histidine kinase
LVAANNAYLAMTGSRESDLLGKYVFEAFPDTGERMQRFKDAFERALAGEENVVAMLPFAIPRREVPEGGMDVRFWSCTHTPVRDAAGRVTHVIQQTLDVTPLVEPEARPQEPDASAALEQDVVRRAVRIEALSQALRAEGEYLKAMFRAAPGFMCVLSGPALVFELANDAYLEMVGRSDIVGRPIREALPELAGQGIFEMLERIVATGEPFHGRDFPLLFPDDSGRPRRIYVDFIWQPILEEDGRVIAVFVQGSDVTDRVLATEQQRVLLDEVNHRVKNTLTTVQAMVQQTLKTTPQPRQFAESLQSRLGALSATHNLLTSRNWSGVGLRELVHLELEPFGVDRVEIEGEELTLSPRRTTNMGLVFHELATNAAKYGALSVPTGRVKVRWTFETPTPDAFLVIDWIEQGGPPVREPQHRGFGTRLIERTIKAKPGASHVTNYRPEGLHWQARLPSETGGVR